VISNLFSKSGQKIVQVDVQRQESVQDCGLFAIAFSTAVLNGNNIRNTRFNQRTMRHHLIRCIDDGTLTPFPTV
jgi:Ulp1 family protease